MNILKHTDTSERIALKTPKDTTRRSRIASLALMGTVLSGITAAGVEGHQVREAYNRTVAAEQGFGEVEDHNEFGPARLGADVIIGLRSFKDRIEGIDPLDDPFLVGTKTDADVDPAVQQDTPEHNV